MYSKVLSHLCMVRFIVHTVSRVADDCAYSQKDNSNLALTVGGVAVAVILITSLAVIVIAALRNYSTSRRKK